MRSITIHNFEEDLEKSLINYANREGVSLNKSVKKLLRKSLGLGSIKKEDFADICGTIDKQEAKRLMSSLADFEVIDKEDW